jgi:hypothetical protein
LETQETREETQEVTIEDPKAVLTALERAKSDAKKFREQAEQLQNSLNEKDAAISQYGDKLISQKLSQKLAAEGIVDADRVVKFIDMSKISLDNDFNIIGFEDQLQVLKNDLPEVFDAKVRVGGQADAATKTSVSTTFSASELQAMKILGKI